MQPAFTLLIGTRWYGFLGPMGDTHRVAIAVRRAVHIEAAGAYMVEHGTAYRPLLPLRR